MPTPPVWFPPMRPRLNGLSVLVADDDDVLRETVAQVLRLEGYVVDGASDGLRAVHGAAVARELRANGLVTPIVVMTGVEDPEKAARDIGAESWLAKPFALGDLLPAIQHACR